MRRQALPRVLVAGALAVLAACAARSSRRVEAVGVTVSDLDTSIAFYRDVLTFEVLARDMDSAELRLGDEHFLLTQGARTASHPVPRDSRGNDLWFQHIAIIVNDMSAAYARLESHGVDGISVGGPQLLPAWNPNAGGIRAYYFHDPDGHALELLEFPVGKGAAKWHAASNRLFLGIDHTAIAVRDTDASVQFYRDQLGLDVRGASVNYGPEQEALSGVPGARVRITGLRGSDGPGVEFLEYLAPHDGRQLDFIPSQGDVAYWHIVLTTSDLTSTPARVLLRDPDGHAVEVGLEVD